MFFSKGGAEWIVAFLGNPGLKYNGTRHNAGFMAADAMEKKLGVSINKMRFKALTQTYMNLLAVKLGLHQLLCLL